MMILKTEMRIVNSCILFMPTHYRSWSELFWCPKFFTLAFCSFIWSFFNAPICPTSKCLAYNMERRGGTITLSQNPCSLQWSLTERSDWLMKVWPSIFDITSFQAETLISPYYNNGGFLPMTPLRQDSYLLDPTQITTNRSPLFPFPSFQMASFLCLNSSATLQDLSEGAPGPNFL